MFPAANERLSDQGDRRPSPSAHLVRVCVARCRYRAAKPGFDLVDPAASLQADRARGGHPDAAAGRDHLLRSSPAPRPNEPGRRIHASIGLARPADPDMYGYIAEHHGFGMTTEQSGEYTEDLAATMLASTLGIEFDPSAAWDERKKHLRTYPADHRQPVDHGGRPGRRFRIVDLRGCGGRVPILT